MKKVLGITNIRSDYDLVSGVYEILDDDPEVDLKLLVGGAHLSPTYGNTFKNIKNDGFEILAKIETLIDSNTPQSRLKTASLLLQSSTDIVAQHSPDAILYAGDREDVIVGGLLGAYLNIPTYHFYGGDHVIDGHVDNAVRHATSKLSTFHMVTIPTHKERLLKMGESEERIFVVGSTALDKFNSHKPYSRKEIKKKFNLPFEINEYALVIFHPQDLERQDSAKYFQNILDSLKEIDLPAFVSYPNTDPGNKDIIDVIRAFEKREQFIFYKNLDRDLFLSIFKKASFLIGNSSAGILEAASIPIPAINVGIRQLGRSANRNVIFCKVNKGAIINSIKKALSQDFKDSIKDIENIYGDGNSSKKAAEIIKNFKVDDLLYKTEDPLNNE
ncbi:MAG: UDP-N-acetylglucosamine 2-epimerase [Balneolaceae bacterium]|nr:UDP-N-acetylglucosamine 2-epimerase [Balneolaceae bacterium]